MCLLAYMCHNIILVCHGCLVLCIQQKFVGWFQECDTKSGSNTSFSHAVIHGFEYQLLLYMVSSKSVTQSQIPNNYYYYHNCYNFSGGRYLRNKNIIVPTLVWISYLYVGMPWIIMCILYYYRISIFKTAATPDLKTRIISIGCTPRVQIST